MSTIPWFGTPNDGATCSVTLGSPTVTVAGSDMIAAGGNDPGFAGQGFIGPDGSTYNVRTVDSATQLTLYSNYRGATVVSAGFFQIIPVQGFSRDASYKLSQLMALVGVNSWIAAGGGVDAITATYSPAISILSDGLLLGFKAVGANTTTTPNFAPNGLTAHTITKAGGVALLAGDIPRAAYECLVRYNLANTRWELLNPVPVPLTTAMFTGRTFFGAQAIACSVESLNVANASTASLGVTAGGANGWSGIVLVSNADHTNASIYTQRAYSVSGRGSSATFTQIGATGTGGAGAGFSISATGNGAITVTNSYGAASDIDIAFFGMMSL